MERLLWARNPDNYIKEAIEVGQSRFVFDKGRMVKRNIDPTSFFELFFGFAPWECLVIDGDTRTAMHLDAEHPSTNPLGVYPVWEYGASISVLNELMKESWGEDQKLCFDMETHVEERPRYGQAHIVVVQNVPDARTTQGKQFFKVLDWMQEEMPHCILHIHGLYSFQLMYGGSFRSVDFDARTDAGYGRITLPTGIMKKPDELGGLEHWTDLFSFKPVELKVPRNRCMFNIKSHRWAAQHFNEAAKIDTNKNREVDPDAIDPPIPENGRIMVSNKKAEDGDKFYCDLCSLQDICKFFRQGSVCIVPGSDAVDLATLFHTRNSDQIIDGLGMLMKVQSKRLEQGLQDEQDSENENGLSPEVTKIINSMFTNGVKLAKLVNPALAKPTVQVSLTQNNGLAISGATPQAMVAGVIQEFERRGIPASDVTPEMLTAVLENPEGLKDRAIDVAEAHNANG